MCVCVHKTTAFLVTDVNDFLAVQRLDLFWSSLPVTVAVAELAVVAVAPGKHLAALRQCHAVAVGANGRSQLYHHEP